MDGRSRWGRRGNCGHSIGCFGPGGNLGGADGAVHHLNFFGRKETADFLARALRGEPQGLTFIEPGSALPEQRSRRRAVEGPARKPAALTAASCASPTRSAGSDAAGRRDQPPCVEFQRCFPAYDPEG